MVCITVFTIYIQRVDHDFIFANTFGYILILDLFSVLLWLVSYALLHDSNEAKSS